MKFLPHSGLIFVLALSTQFCIAQSTIVLINEQPTRVQLDKGEVTAIYEEVPRHMDGYTKSPDDAFKKFRIQDIKNDTPITVVQNDVPSEVTDDVAEPIEIAPSGVTDVEPAVNFDSGSAILDDAALATIKSYSSFIKDQKRSSIVLKSWFRSGDLKSQELVKNRLDACRAYLEANGVPSNLIVTSLIGSNRESKFVSVTLN